MASYSVQQLQHSRVHECQTDRPHYNNICCNSRYPSSSVGQGSQCRPVGLSHYMGPSAIPRKFPAILGTKVTAGIAKSTTIPAHMTTSPVRSHRPNQAITHPYTVRLTKRFHSPHRKPPGKATQPEQQTSHTTPPCHRDKRGAGEPPQGFQARQEN